MGVKPPRAIGQFAWIFADVGVECGTCGRVQVYCDFESLERFRERGWATGVEEATKRFRCRCGSRNVRLRPVSITLRPKPVPVRPEALRPIYAEDVRKLFRRGPADFPDALAIEVALDVLRLDADCRIKENQPEDQVRAALETLRPFCYRRSVIDEFVRAARRKHESSSGSAETRAFGMILRELGRE